MKKYNEIMYKEMKKNGEYKDQYYKYIIIDKKYIFKGWESQYITRQKYEFYGVLDTEKEDIYTEDDIVEIQEEITKQAIQEIQEEIIKNKEKYKNIQKANFNILIENEEFKRGINYYFYDSYTSNNFLELYIKGTTPEELQEEQYKKLIEKKHIFSNEMFFKKYTEENTSDILKECKEYIKDDRNIDKWKFEYNWNNDKKINLNIDPTFKNEISLKLNKYDYITENYKKLYNDPTKELIKIKKMYNICNNFYKENNNKTCKIVMTNGQELKVLDFEYFLTILKSGQNKHCCYRLFTNKDLDILEKINEEKGRGTRNNDIYIEDIMNIEYSKKNIYTEV